MAVINKTSLTSKGDKQLTLKEEAVKNLLWQRLNLAENALLEFEAMLESDDQLKQKILEVANQIAELRQYTI